MGSERGWRRRASEDSLVVEGAEIEERPGTALSIHSGLVLHSLTPSATCLPSPSTPSRLSASPPATQPFDLPFAPQQRECKFRTA